MITFSILWTVRIQSDKVQGIQRKSAMRLKAYSLVRCIVIYSIGNFSIEKSINHWAVTGILDDAGSRRWIRTKWRSLRTARIPTRRWSTRITGSSGSKVNRTPAVSRTPRRRQDLWAREECTPWRVPGRIRFRTSTSESWQGYRLRSFPLHVVRTISFPGGRTWTIQGTGCFKWVGSPTNRTSECRITSKVSRWWKRNRSTSNSRRAPSSRLDHDSEHR